MIPAPTVFDVFRMFRNDPQPITDEQLKKNYGDSLLAHTYLPSLIEEGWILRNENGWYMSKKAIDAAIQNAEEKIEGWQKLIAHMQSLLPEPIIKLDDPITEEEWKMLTGLPRNKGVYRFILFLKANNNTPQNASSFMDYGSRISAINSTFKRKGIKFRFKCVFGHGHFERKEFKVVRIS